MNVTAKDYKPYWFELKEEEADGSKKLTGMDYLLLETVADALNFSIKVLPIANWAEALDRVVSKESFITPVIHAVLRQRLKRFEYTIPYTYASYSLSMKMPGLTPQWQSLYYPLAGTVWMSVVLVTGLMIVVMYVMNRAGDFSSPPRRLEPGTVALEVVGTLFSQNLFKTLPTTDPSRVLVVFWLIFAFVVGTAYRGNLTAALTLPKYPSKPETLKEVVEVVHKVTIEPWGEDYKTYFKESDTEVFMKLADMMELGPALLDGLQEATEDSTAHMDSRAVLELNIAESFTRRDGTSELYVVRESAIPGMAAWPIPHDSPFKKNLDFCIRASLEAGLYEKWESDMLEMARRESRERQRRQQRERPQDEEEEAEGSEGGIQALTLVHMQGPLMLLLLGLLLGALAFLLEMLTSSEGRERNNADL
ncbi:uncharacterized protein LOC125034746 [Penaeus chinensis]|uniref:uncharacterized protein LOC125034746 n=1 Tax=Penaeus chinensis TaxID=139456 RepID=UPI001FB7F365|nr:uncharacterized protein LOC125034746 [Penaeus chinensis]